MIRLLRWVRRMRQPRPAPQMVRVRELLERVGKTVAELEDCGCRVVGVVCEMPDDFPDEDEVPF